jgi:CRISPR-associated protein Cas5t
MSMIGLFVSVPIASFRVPQAREYWETFPCPPPATVYGMLLSAVGEPNRLRHEGAEVALALLSAPELSVVVRTLWRVKDRKQAPGMGENRRPDFQELLSNVRLAVWVRTGLAEAARPSLSDRVAAAFERPSEVNRFGGLSLGESPHLVDELRTLRPADHGEGRLLLGDAEGDLALPVWPDHVGAAGTRWGQYRLAPAVVGTEPDDGAWTVLQRPEKISDGRKALSTSSWPITAWNIIQRKDQ